MNLVYILLFDEKNIANESITTMKWIGNINIVCRSETSVGRNLSKYGLKNDEPMLRFKV